MKKSEKSLIHHFVSNIAVLLLAIGLILVFSARKNHTRQMEQISEYIDVLSSRTAEHVSDVFEDKRMAITSAAYLNGELTDAPSAEPSYLETLEKKSGFDLIR